eukprot:COSAG02_NODE_8105_length_2708_cov_1.353009_1_plen_251_part_00
MVWCGCNADVGFYEDSAGVAYIGSQKSGYELMHRIPQSLLDAVWTQRSVDGVPAGATLDVAINSTASAYRVAPISPSLNHNGGLSISVWLRPTFGANVADASSVQVGSSLTASCDAGSFVLTTFESSVEFNFTIGGERTTIVPTGMCVDELLVTTMSRGPTHVGIVVDGGSHVLSMVVNGVLCDGNKDGKVHNHQGPRGWLYLPEQLHSLGGCQLDVVSDDAGIGHVRVYPRALLTTEMIGSWRAGEPSD